MKQRVIVTRFDILKAAAELEKNFAETYTLLAEPTENPKGPSAEIITPRQILELQKKGF